VDAAALARAGRPPGAGRVVALAGMGDGAGPLVVERGLADVLLRRPLAPRECAAVLARLASGEAFDDPTATPEALDTLPRFPRARVLVADDGAVNREVACEALARLGIRAETVEDGRQAVEALAARAYDLVLMDGSMPELDGFAATRLIRAAEADGTRPRTAVVALTAHVMGAEAEAWREAGMDGVLHKPYGLRALADCVAAHLGAGHAPVLAAAPEPPAADVPLLDPAVLSGLEDMVAVGGPGFVARVVGLYTEHAPKGVEALRDAVAAGDPDAAARAAHGLKSMSLNLGATRLARRLAEIEALSRGSARVPTAADLDHVARLLDETLAALHARDLDDAARPPAQADRVA
jgi:CheY-like chemotaxis protein/HPt (histidine-containing phosphotransfer) domain-containing protein